MTQTYHIQGMTCNGCKDSVTRAFQSLKGVDRVEVDLEKGTATLTMDAVIPTNLFKEVLPSKFTLISPSAQPVKQNNLANSAKKTPNKSKLEQLKPLFLIFGFLLLISGALNFRVFTPLKFMLDFMIKKYIELINGEKKFSKPIVFLLLRKNGKKFEYSLLQHYFLIL